MKIFGMGAPELIIILLVVVLLIFGPKNLPKLGKSLGKAVRNVRDGMSGSDKEATKTKKSALDRADDEDEEEAEIVDDDEEEVIPKRKKTAKKVVDEDEDEE